MGPASAPIRPWSEVKSRRGAPKRITHRGLSLVPISSARTSGSPMHTSMPSSEMASMAKPSGSRPFVPGLPRHVLFQAQYSPYRLKTPSQQIAMVLSVWPKGWMLPPPNGLRLSTSDHHHLADSRWATRTDLARTLAFAPSRSPTSNWTNCAPGCGVLSRCYGSGWLLIPCTKIFPCSSSAPNTTHGVLTHPLSPKLLAPGCLPLFTSDGLNTNFYALDAHFGQWLTFCHRGRTVRRWQVEPASLIYGQANPLWAAQAGSRLTHDASGDRGRSLESALQGMGFTGRLNTAFIERVNLYGPPWNSRAGSSSRLSTAQRVSTPGFA